MVQPLIIDDIQKEAVASLVLFAQEEENWYRLQQDKWIPGHREEYCVHLNNYRCVFTHTVVEGVRHRHLSISIPGKNYPNPIAFYTIATWFGFTGAKMLNDVAIEPGKWGFCIHEQDGCIILVEEIGKVE